MDLIDRTAAIEELYEWELCYDWNDYCRENSENPWIVSPGDIVDKLPSAQPEITRCKYCAKHSESGLCGRWSMYGTVTTKDDDFCSYAERRKE